MNNTNNTAPRIPVTWKAYNSDTQTLHHPKRHAPTTAPSTDSNRMALAGSDRKRWRPLRHSPDRYAK